MLAVLRTARRLTAAGDAREVVRVAAEAACAVLGYSACAAALRSEDGSFRYELAAGAGREDEQQLRTRVVSTRAYDLLIQAATPIGAVRWVPAGHPVRHQPEVIAATLATGVSVGSGTWERGSLLIVPMADERGAVVGFLTPDDPRSGHLPDDAQALLLGSLAELTEVALETVAAREVARRALAVAEAQRRQLEDLLTASVAVRGRCALDEVLQEIVLAMTTAAGFTRAAVYLLDQGTGELWVRASVGLDEAEDRRLREAPVPLEEFAALMRPEMQVSRSFLFDHRYHHLPSELEQKLSALDPDPQWEDGRWHCLDTLTVPMDDAGGSLIGVISLDEPASRRLPALADIRAVEMFADQCSIAVGESRRYEQAMADAGTDPLTGLPNRRTLFARAGALIAEAERRGQPCAVAFLD
ncbi:MAG: GAF domain-containing protein, partial [Acidimicrobiales bacterium]